MYLLPVTVDRHTLDFQLLIFSHFLNGTKSCFCDKYKSELNAVSCLDILKELIPGPRSFVDVQAPWFVQAAYIKLYIICSQPWFLFPCTLSHLYIT